MFDNKNYPRFALSSHPEFRFSDLVGCEEKDDAMESDVDIDEKCDEYMGQGPAEPENSGEEKDEAAEVEKEP